MSSEDEREEKFDSTDPIVLRALVTGNFIDIQRDRTMDLKFDSTDPIVLRALVTGNFRDVQTMDRKFNSTLLFWETQQKDR